MPENTLVFRRCTFCGKVHDFDLDTERYDRWRAGEHIQNVWPEWTAEERETLISGTCPACWDFEYMKGDD